MTRTEVVSTRLVAPAVARRDALFELLDLEAVFLRFDCLLCFSLRFQDEISFYSLS